MKLSTAIQKIFGDEKQKYYTPPDIINTGDRYLFYERHDSDRVILWLGTEVGCTALQVISDGDTLLKLANLMIYGK